MQKCQNIKCNKSFIPKTSNQKFCCPKCQNATNQRKFYKNLGKKCVDCGKIVKNTSVRCGACSRHNNGCYGKQTTLKEFHPKQSIKGKHPSWKNAHIRNLSRYWNADKLLLPCYVCGYSKHVEISHIKPISSFSETSTLEEVNHPTNVIQLCPNCHWEFDHNLIQLNGVPTGIRTQT